MMYLHFGRACTLLHCISLLQQMSDIQVLFLPFLLGDLFLHVHTILFYRLQHVFSADIHETKFNFVYLVLTKLIHVLMI